MAVEDDGAAESFCSLAFLMSPKGRCKGKAPRLKGEIEVNG